LDWSPQPQTTMTVLRAGCSYTATFDRKALRLPGFASL
jgi:hypothetical protein